MDVEERKNMSELRTFVVSASAGDREAFRHVYDFSNDKVFRFLLGQLRDRELALDTLQETFIDLWKALPKFRFTSDEEFWGFLFTIARRKVYAVRKNAHKANVAVDNETLEFLHESTDPHTPLHEDDRALHGALAKLGILSREVLGLRYWSELSFKEIALALETTENTAKVRHHRAIKELQTYLPTSYVEQRFI